MKYNLNIYVFTTKFVVKNRSQIIYVSHENNGDWQFLGKEENLHEDDAMIISLGEILQQDPTLSSILDLPMGYEAIRKGIGTEWELNIINDTSDE